MLSDNGHVVGQLHTSCSLNPTFVEWAQELSVNGTAESLVMLEAQIPPWKSEDEEMEWDSQQASEDQSWADLGT